MSAVTLTSDQYRQAARRIRARLGDQPARMHQALNLLAAARDATPAPQLVTATPSAPPSAAEQFTQLVIAHLDGPILRMDVRQKLLRQAERLGLGRFEANLLIALVEHRHKGHMLDAPPIRRRELPGWLIFLILQTAIVGSVWWLLAA